MLQVARVPSKEVNAIICDVVQVTSTQAAEPWAQGGHRYQRSICQLVAAADIQDLGELPVKGMTDRQ